MKLILSALVLSIAVGAAGCGETTTVTQTVTVTGTTKHEVGPPGERVEFGYIKSLRRKDRPTSSASTRPGT